MKEIYQEVSGSESATLYQVQSIQAVASIWQALEAKTQAHFFLSWFWMGSWLELISPVTQVYFFCYRQNSDVKAICFLTLCPATRKKGLVRLTQLQMNEYLTGPYNMVNGYSGMLMEPGFEQAAWNKLIKTAQAFNNTWDEFYISSLEKQQRMYCEAALGNLTPLEDKKCYVWAKPLPPSDTTEDGLIETFKRKTRQQLRQTIKAFADIGTVKIELASNLTQAKEFFILMDETHSQRWQAVGKQGSYVNQVWVRFHEKLMERYFDAGLILLFKVSLDDKAVGYLYGHCYRNKIFMHQTGFPHLEDNRLRAGYLSHYLAILHSVRQGRSEYDLLPDFAGCYKKFFVEQGDEIVWLALRRDRLIFKWETLIERLKSLKHKKDSDEAAHENQNN